jgi:hypothetical protein
MWDNRLTKTSPKQPDYKCKNKQCAKAVWLEKSAPVAHSNGNGATPPMIHGRPLGPLYAECLKFAKEACKYHFGDTTTPADVVAATATLFIQAVKDGGTIRAAKPAPPPPPPPPPVRDPYEYQSSDHDLPF